MNEVREVFQRVIANQMDADKIAKLELAREYFTNPTFRKAFEQFTWELNSDSYSLTPQ